MEMTACGMALDAATHGQGERELKQDEYCHDAIM